MALQREIGGGLAIPHVPLGAMRDLSALTGPPNWSAASALRYAGRGFALRSFALLLFAGRARLLLPHDCPFPRVPRVERQLWNAIPPTQAPETVSHAIKRYSDLQSSGHTRPERDLARHQGRL